MGAFTYIETDTGTNVDISAATAVGAYTSTGDKLIMVDVSIDAVAGNGNYVMYVTRKIGGSGSAYRILPQTTMTAASGLTAISGQSGWITVRNGDVLTCYVDGLAGDTATPDWTTRWFELAGVTAAAVADAVLDEATSGHTSAGSFGKAVTDILADTGTDGVVLANDAITAAKFDESTAFPIKSADAGSTLIARAGADGYDLTEINDTLITDGVVVQTIVDNAITADVVKADAVTKIQSGLALEATLTAIKGAGWSTETLAAIDVLIDAIKAKTDLIPATPAEAGEYTAAIAAVKSVADDILVDTGTTLDALIKDIPTNAELATALGTADDAVLAAVAAAKVVIDNIHDTDLPAVKAETALIVEDTGTTIPATLATLAGYTDGIAGDVWSHPTRTLTVPAVAMSDPEDGTTLTLYKDADINIEFTGLTIPTGAKKVVFTIKDNLDDADTAAALQATYQLTAVPAETHTLNYINSAVPPVLTTPVKFTVDTDSVEFDMTAAAAYYLPRYERGYLHWDLKLITDTTVQILQQGLVQILGTSTRAVA